jgi:hypothetical protein
VELKERRVENESFTSKRKLNFSSNKIWKNEKASYLCTPETGERKRGKIGKAVKYLKRRKPGVKAGE